MCGIFSLQPLQRQGRAVVQVIKATFPRMYAGGVRPLFRIHIAPWPLAVVHRCILQPFQRRGRWLLSWQVHIYFIMKHAEFWHFCAKCASSVSERKASGLRPRLTNLCSSTREWRVGGQRQVAGC